MIRIFRDLLSLALLGVLMIVCFISGVVLLSTDYVAEKIWGGNGE